MRIIQTAHVTETPGPVQTLAQFLDKNNTVTKLYYPLVTDGKTWKYAVHMGKLFGVLLRDRAKYEVGVGMTCLDTLPLLLLRNKLGLKKIVYINVDFSRHRFENKLFNWLYVRIDRYCAQKADVVAVNTSRVREARIKEGVVPAKIELLPNGVFAEEIKYVPNTWQKTLIYLGHVSWEHGLKELLECMQHVDLKLIIIGDGPDMEVVTGYIKARRLLGKCQVRGRMAHKDALELLGSAGAVGVAPYQDSDWVHYCDPVKVKEYLASGCPVLMSDLPETASEIKKNKLGWVYKDTAELALRLEQIEQMKDKEYQELVLKSRKEGQKYYYEEIYRNFWESNASSLVTTDSQV